MYLNLLAKTWRPNTSATPPPYCLLVPHLRAVQAAAEAIADGAGVTILRNLGLPPDVWLSRLRVVLSRAAVLHDLGKANSYFQGMVRGKAGFPPSSQPIRHELLTALILLRNSGGVTNWLHQEFADEGLGALATELTQTVIGAVAGHHVKMDNDWTKAFSAANHGGGGTSIDLYLNHPNLQTLFRERHPPGNETWSLLPSGATYPGKTQTAFNIGSADWIADLRGKPDWWRFAATVKALTTAADVAGSALLPEGVSPRGWVTNALKQRPDAAQLRDVVAARLQGRALRPFQQAIADSPARVTLVEAGCGSGKTAAGYLWAARHAQGRKLFFCYPTTGTATEGFLDYVYGSDVEAALIHSRASVDLEGVATTEDQDVGDEQLRIASLNAWHPQAVVCTIDTVLALLRNNRRGLYASPAVLAGCFIFDELHAYDNEMFAAVVAFIRALPGAPFLLMSASLPAHRKAFLMKHVHDVATVPPPAELEAIPRYLIRRCERTDSALAEAIQHVQSGGRVLWVCNVVARAQAVFDLARSRGVATATYHSRFKYEDRVARHREVVGQFAAEGGTGVLAITTQVAEMSLDLDADLLVSELAPVPALIQRLGRLNRRVSEHNHGVPRHALVVTPDSERPYREEALASADIWLERLCALNRPLSQHDLASLFREQADEKTPRLELQTEWLDSGWCAMPGLIREPGFNVNIILAQDADACRADSKELIKRTLPMPYQPRMENWQRVRGTFVAPPDAIQYDTQKGASWAN